MLTVHSSGWPGNDIQVVFYWLELGPDLGNQDALKQANQRSIRP